MKRLILFLCAILMLMTLGCSRNAEKFLEKGDYNKAFDIALKNLDKDRRSKKDRTVLNKAFNEINKDRSSEYDQYVGSDVIEDWEIAYGQYEQLLDKYDAGKKFLSDAYDDKLEAKRKAYDRLTQAIADNYFRMGNESMKDYRDTFNKAFAQDAYSFYNKTAHYKPYYPRIDNLLGESLEFAMIEVLVITEVPYDRSLKREIDREFDRIESESSGFEEILYERNIEYPDCLIRIIFGGLDIDVDQDRDQRTFSEEIEDGYDTRTDTSGVQTQIPRYRTISADVNIITERITYEWRLEVVPEGSPDICHYEARRFSEEESIINEFYEISGDSRAVPSQFLEPVYDSRDEEDAIEDLIEELYNKVRRAYF